MLLFQATGKALRFATVLQMQSPSCCLCVATVNEFVRTRARLMAEMVVQPCPRLHPSEVPSKSSTFLTPVQFLERQELFLGKCLLGVSEDHKVHGASLMLPRTQRHAESEVTRRGCPGDANDDSSRIRNAGRLDWHPCVSALVTSHFSSNNATPRNGRVVSTLFRYRIVCCFLVGVFDFVGWDSINVEELIRDPQRLRHLFSQFLPLSRPESQGCSLSLKTLSGLFGQLGR